MTQQPPAYQAPQPQAVVVQQPQVVTLQPGPATVSTTNQPRRGNWKGLGITGVIQIVLGVLTIILGIITIPIQAGLYFYGAPLWGGLMFYVVAGILGAAAAQTKNPCTAVAYMVMSILACLAACNVIGFGGAGIAVDTQRCIYRSGYPYYEEYYICNPAGYLAVDSLLVILGLVEFVVSIVGAALTCGIVCTTAPPQTVIHYQAQPQVVVTGQPQGVMYTTSAPQQYGYQAQQLVAPPKEQF